MPKILFSLLPTEGALLRTLGLVDRSGHEIVAMHAARVAAQVDVRLDLVDSVREPEALVHALYRLPEVMDVRWHRESSSPAADGWSAAGDEPPPPVTYGAV
ncbi:MAG: ACT domain-containing protein [Gemmatimonadaceae bacterium]|nr:ACT domain-containing protein [Gemmatimonadaceae bacterium]